MLILSQDKTRLINFESGDVYLERYDDSGYPVVDGYAVLYRYPGNKCYTIGIYPENRAVQILKEISEEYKGECYSIEVFDQAACATKPYTFRNNTVYEMPER